MMSSGLEMIKGIVSRDFGGLQKIFMVRIGVPDIPLEVYSFLNFRFQTINSGFLHSLVCIHGDLINPSLAKLQFLGFFKLFISSHTHSLFSKIVIAGPLQSDIFLFVMVKFVWGTSHQLLVPIWALIVRWLSTSIVLVSNPQMGLDCQVVIHEYCTCFLSPFGP